MNSSDRLVGSPSRQRIEQFHEARLVKITHGGLAIWLHPFGMLNRQGAANRLPQLGVGADLGRYGKCLTWNVHLYPPPLSRLPSRVAVWLPGGTGICVSEY